VRKAYFFMIAGVSLLALLLVPLMAGMARADGSQTWFLTDDSASIVANDGTVHAFNKIMSKDEQPCPASEESHWISGLMTAWWYSEQSADCGVTFGEEDDWVVDLCVWACGSGELQAQVWSIDGSGNMESLLAEGNKTYVENDDNDGYQKVTIECEDNAETDQTIPEGSRIGLRVSCSSGGLALYTCSGYCSSSQLHSPGTDAGFPMPELSAMVLLAGGLGCLAGFMAWRRWRADANAADSQHS